MNVHKKIQEEKDQLLSRTVNLASFFRCKNNFMDNSYCYVFLLYEKNVVLRKKKPLS